MHPIEIVKFDDPSSPLQAARLKEFEVIYTESFPDADEREPVGAWIDRVSTPDVPSPRSNTHILLAVDHSNGAQAEGTVCGGVVMEHYRRSCCGQLTYLAVSQVRRRMGLGRHLLAEAARVLHREAAVRHSRIMAVFAECNDPRRVEASADSMQPWQRLQILSKLGARWLNVPYVQPPLGSGKTKVENLLLLAFPSLVPSAGTVIAGEVVSGFISEFFEDFGFDVTADAEAAALLAALKESAIPVKDLLELR